MALPPSAAIGTDVVLLGMVALVKAAVEDNVTTAAANHRFWTANCGEANPTGAWGLEVSNFKAEFIEQNFNFQFPVYSKGPHWGDHEAMLGDTKGLENRDARAGTVNYEDQLTKTERQKGEQVANPEGPCQKLKQQYPIEVQKQGYLL